MARRACRRHPLNVFALRAELERAATETIVRAEARAVVHQKAQLMVGPALADLDRGALVAIVSTPAGTTTVHFNPDDAAARILNDAGIRQIPARGMVCAQLSLADADRLIASAGIREQELPW